MLCRQTEQMWNNVSHCQKPERSCEKEERREKEVGGSRTTWSDAANAVAFPTFNNSVKGEKERWVIELEIKTTCGYG